MARFLDWLAGRDSATPVAEHSSLADLIVSSRLEGLTAAQVDYTKVPAVARAKTMTQKVIASFPVAAWRGTERVAQQPPIVAQPNPDQTVRQFLEDTADEMQRGEAYWELSNYSGLFPTEARVIPGNHVRVTWDTDQTTRVYEHKSGRLLRASGPFRNLAVIPLDRGPRDLCGKGPLSSDRIDGIVATLNYIQEYFENHGAPTGIVRKPGTLTPEEARKLKAQWVDARTTRTPAVLSGGLEWDRTAFSPSDSAWVDAYFATVLDAANLWGIPASILGFNSPGSSLRYENTQDAWEAWYRGTLHPVYLETISAEWSRLVPRGQDVRFSSQTLTRLAASERADFYTKALDPDSGWLTRDEVRELEGIAASDTPIVERSTVT